ncbi:amidohydrolase family protein [uncultured Roseobacter sp.]|uniref:N-acyl-D-amino-acid deacylase family protein n=1 Tax=uncultured Roseobacter sp. TaxID=114847 RepID=UPI0026152AEB|nr:amidohydrolase family protein [uncultured Roseobacter sp.]
MLDIILSGGIVYDGSGDDPKAADIGVKNGRIAEIGDLAGAEATQKVDVSGLAVAPGFIDLHTHSDFTLMADGRAQSQVHQGVTTEVIGQCGFSSAPAHRPDDAKIMSPGFTEGMVDIDWTSFGDYLDHLDRMPLGVNVAAFVGHGSVHRAVLGDALRPADDDELDQMKDLVAESIDQGAYGLSTGLEYWPGSLATPEQITELVEVAARKDVLYATHVRNRDVHYDIGFGEAISCARAAGARLQISHIQPKHGAPSWAMEHAIEMVEAAKSHGCDIAYDVIPHDWSHTRVMAIMPQWAQEGGVAAVMARLKDKKTREKIKANRRPMWRVVLDDGWDRIVLMQSEHNLDLVGLTFAEIGRRRGVDPYDAALDLLIEEGEKMNHLMWTSQSFSEDQIRLAISQPDCAIISDTLALAPDGCLKHHIGSLSGYGWAARFLQHYVRDHAVISLQDGIRRLTSLPASRLGISDRGTLKNGGWADITVFDAEQIESHCDVHDPRRYATGIAHVLVNGVFSISDGERTNGSAGRVLRSH